MDVWKVYQVTVAALERIDTWWGNGWIRGYNRCDKYHAPIPPPRDTPIHSPPPAILPSIPPLRDTPIHSSPPRYSHPSLALTVTLLLLLHWRPGQEVEGILNHRRQGGPPLGRGVPIIEAWKS